jgi:hypothetical protein
MEQIDVGIIIGRRGNRRSAEHDHLARVVGAAGDVVDAVALDVHAGNQHHIGPGEVLRRRAPDVLVDEADVPRSGNEGGDDQNPLRRHEALDVAHEQKRVVEGAEAVAVTREHAQNPAPVSRLETAQGGGFGLDRRSVRDHALPMCHAPASIARAAVGRS